MLFMTLCYKICRIWSGGEYILHMGDSEIVGQNGKKIKCIFLIQN